MSVFLKRTTIAAVAIAVLIESMALPSVRAGGFRAPWNKRTSVEKLAAKIDRLNRHIDEYGSVVAKHPDVWGDRRLSKHRADVEAQLQNELTTFTFWLNGTVSQSDSAFLGDAIALQAGTAMSNTTTGSATGPTSVTSTMLSLPTSSTPPSNQIIRTAPFNGTGPTFNGTAPKFASTSNGISIEATEFLDQKNRYLQHLNELRRTNESDDTSVSPGYSLNLIRIPVSILPGRKTSHGYGAEITITATPHLTEQLLPDTVKSMVITDVVEVYSNILTTMVTEYVPDTSTTAGVAALAAPGTTPSPSQAVTRLSQPNQTKTKPTMGQPSDSPASPVNSVISDDLLNAVCWKLYNDLDIGLRDGSRVNLLELTQRFRPYLMKTYSMLSDESAQILWTHCTEELHSILVREDKDLENQKLNLFLADYYQLFLQKQPAQSPDWLREKLLGKGTDDSPGDPNAGLAWLIIRHSALINAKIRTDIQNISKSKNCPCGCGAWNSFIGTKPSPESCQAFNQYVNCRWPVIVFALDPENEEQNVGSTASIRRELQLAAAVAASRGLFGFQNLTNYVRRMELDVATVAVNRTQVGFSHGNDTFGWRFSPRLQPPSTTDSNLKVFARDLLIGGPSREQQLKHTKLEAGIRECSAVVLLPSFVPYVTLDSRANWFRIDNPDCRVYRSSKALPVHARLLDLEDSVELSKEITELRTLSQQCLTDQHQYRDGEVYRLMRSVDQLDRSLPLQTVEVQLPYDGDISPIDLFERGTYRLAPRLFGWYGQPGIVTGPGSFTNSKVVSDLKAKIATTQAAIYSAAIAGTDTSTLTTSLNALNTTLALASNDSSNQVPSGTSLFLVGKHFSLFNTQIIAGGIDVTSSMKIISRELCQVTIPSTVATVTETNVDSTGKKQTATVVDIHLLTPYGATSRLTIPTISSAPAAAPASAAPAASSIVPLTLSWLNTPEIRAIVGSVDGQQVVSGSIFDARSSKIDNLTLTLTGEADGAFSNNRQPVPVKFIAIAKGKSDTASKNGITIGPIDAMITDNGQVTLPANDFLIALGAQAAALVANGGGDLDLNGYIRFVDGRYRPTYKNDKSILLRVQLLPGTTNPGLVAPPPPAPMDSQSRNTVPATSSDGLQRETNQNVAGLKLKLRSKTEKGSTSAKPILQTRWSARGEELRTEE